MRRRRQAVWGVLLGILAVVVTAAGVLVLGTVVTVHTLSESGIGVAGTVALYASGPLVAVVAAALGATLRRPRVLFFSAAVGALACLPAALALAPWVGSVA